MKKKCRLWERHDWYIIDEEYYYHGDGDYTTYQNKVCLTCGHFKEEIPYLKARLERDRKNKLSRKELAQELWEDRYNPNR